MLADSRLPCLLEKGTSSLVPLMLPLLQLLGRAAYPPSKANHNHKGEAAHASC